ITKEERVKQWFPYWSPHEKVRFAKIMPPKSAAFAFSKPLKTPKPIPGPTRVTLEVEPESNWKATKSTKKTDSRFIRIDQRVYSNDETVAEETSLNQSDKQRDLEIELSCIDWEKSIFPSDFEDDDEPIAIAGPLAKPSDGKLADHSLKVLSLVLLS